MLLETEDGPPLENPTEAQLRQAVEGLGRRPGTFAILTRCREPLELMQASGEQGAFLVEFHEGGRHFRAADEAMTLESALELLTSYRRGDDAWRTTTPWTDVTKELAGARWPVVALIGLVTAALVTLILCYSFR